MYRGDAINGISYSGSSGRMQHAASIVLIEGISKLPDICASVEEPEP
jgi:hypothetical protein